MSSREPSPKLKFLMVYLALERLIKIKKRGEEAQSLISSFIKQAKESGLTDTEKASLVGSLSNLKNGSFSGAFKSFSKRIITLKLFEGLTPVQLASKCIDLRNKIAHGSEVEKDADMISIIKGLREFTLGLLWNKYKLPDMSVYRPADQVGPDKFETRLL